MLDDALMARRNAGRRMLKLAVPGLVAFSSVIQAAFVVLLMDGLTIAVGQPGGSGCRRRTGPP